MTCVQCRGMLHNVPHETLLCMRGSMQCIRAGLAMFVQLVLCVAGAISRAASEAVNSRLATFAVLVCYCLAGVLLCPSAYA